MSADIWVLTDSRVGNNNQAIALAEALSSSYEIKNIDYNRLSCLPNFLLAIKPVHIQFKTLKSLYNAQAPKLIISSGRKTAAIAVYFKKTFAKKPKIIQIMRPNLAFSAFDLVILPQHDSIYQLSPNIVRIIGALNNIKSKAKEAIKSFREYYPELKNFIAVTIGGSSKRYNFDESEAQSLSLLLKQVVEHHPIPLFISFSRRTSSSVKQLIKNQFTWPHVIFDPDSNIPNTYNGMLSAADYIICTADSISMCSEAAALGKPLYIFYTKNFNLKKHRFFVQQLIDLGIAKKFDQTTSSLENYSYAPFNELNRVVNIVNSELLASTDF